MNIKYLARISITEVTNSPACDGWREKGKIDRVNLWGRIQPPILDLLQNSLCFKEKFAKKCPFLDIKKNANICFFKCYS